MKKSLTAITVLITTFLFLFCGCPGGKQKAREVEMAKDAIAASLDNSFQLKHNQTAIIESENISVKFLNVAEDSRCPEGVECVWPGQAKIELEIKRNDSDPELITLISLAGQDELAVKQINGYFIKLVKVEPPRRQHQELLLSDYLITLDISKNDGREPDQ